MPTQFTGHLPGELSTAKSQQVFCLDAQPLGAYSELTGRVVVPPQLQAPACIDGPHMLPASLPVTTTPCVSGPLPVGLLREP